MSKKHGAVSSDLIFMAIFLSTSFIFSTPSFSMDASFYHLFVIIDLSNLTSKIQLLKIISYFHYSLGQSLPTANLKPK